MVFKELTDVPLLLQHAALEDPNKLRQARASVNFRGVNAAVNSIMIWHVQPVLDVRANGVTAPGYSSFHSQTNPIFDPAVTLANKFATMDLDPGTFCAPEFQHSASPNPCYYHDSFMTGHNNPRFGAVPVGAAAQAPLPHVSLSVGTQRYVNKNLPALYDPGT